MPTYLAWIPGKNLSAEVDAPDSKHARTTLLDYMSRNGMISWRDRQNVRKTIKTERVEPGEVQTTVQLDYDMRDSTNVPSEMMGVGPVPSIGEDYSQSELDDVMAMIGSEEPQGLRPSVTPPQPGSLDVRVRREQVPDVRPTGAAMEKLKQATVSTPPPQMASQMPMQATMQTSMQRPSAAASIAGEAAATPIGKISKQMGSVGSKLKDLTVTYSGGSL